MSMVLAVILLSLWTTFAPAATPADSAVFGVFQQAGTGLAHFAVLQRSGTTKEFDLVIAMGGPNDLGIEEAPWLSWSEERKIGLFLQEKTRPGRGYALGTKSGFEDCDARMERVTVTGTVISCRNATDKCPC
jgi:hypothetical protein